MSNAIQHIIDNMLYLWEDAVSKPVKMVRIVINPGDETMLKAFYDYMLAIDSEEEDMVFVIELPFASPNAFAGEVIEYIAQQIAYWNDSEKPEDIPFERIDWTPNYDLADKENNAFVVVENFNRLVESMVGDTDLKCSFIFDISGTVDCKECQEWFSQALALPFHKQMVWGIGDVKGNERFGKLMAKYSEETASIYPPIDMDNAMEQLAEQAVNEDKNDPAAAKFRLALIKLMNSVKNGDESQTEILSKQCLDMALANVKRDVNWLSQFVTIYTILYTDRITRKDMKMALFFVDKAIEAAKLGVDKLDPSLSYRLLGNTLMGKGGILIRQSSWQDATEVYREGADAYALCKDYLMQAEALRMCGWCWEKNYDESLAAECYVEGFRLAEKLSKDLIKNSSYPLLLLSLLNNSKRMDTVSNEDIDKVLSKVIGKDWEDYLYEYKRNLGKYYGLAEHDMDETGTPVNGGN